MQVGDKVWEYPRFTEIEGSPGTRGRRPVRRQGTVIFIHPKKRFYCVEFQPKGKSLMGDRYQSRLPLRECFCFR